MKVKSIIASLVIALTITGIFPSGAFAATNTIVENDITSETIVEENVQTENEEINTEENSANEEEVLIEETDEIAEEITVIDKAPKNVTVKDAKGYTTVSVSWSAVPNAVGYKLYKSTSPDGKFTEVTTTTKTNYTVSGLTTGQTNYFKVNTILKNSSITTSDNEVVETESDIVEGKSLLDSTSVKSYLNTGTKASVSWSKVSGATGYVIYKKDRGSWKKVRVVSQKSTAKTVHGNLEKSETHIFGVVPYRKINGKASRGTIKAASVYVPKALRTSTSTYKYTNQAKIIKKARTKLGRPYVWGASGPYSFDCSGFTYWTMKNSGVKGVRFARTSSQMMYKQHKKYNIGRDLSKAQPGDILLFGYGRSTSRIFHVGIYYGNGNYIHATTGGRGVTITKVPTSCMVAMLRMPGLR